MGTQLAHTQVFGRLTALALRVGTRCAVGCTIGACQPPLTAKARRRLAKDWVKGELVNSVQAMPMGGRDIPPQGVGAMAWASFAAE